MKSRFLAVGLLFSAVANAQIREIPDDPAMRLEKLRLDAPPALVLIGNSAASVQRPNTPRALIASLVSATGNSGIVPNGFAMETTPYWLASHPILQLDDYYHASLGQRLKYFTALSVATARPKASGDSIAPDAHVSIAVRTLLANGHPNPALLRVSGAMRKAQIDYIRAFMALEMFRPKAGPLETAKRRLARQDELLSTLSTRVLVGEQRELRDSTMRTLARRDSERAQVADAEQAAVMVARLDKELDALDEKLAHFAEQFAEEDLDPDGFILEFAAGMHARFSEGLWSGQRVDGLGLWLTPMYRISSKKFEAIGVVRYLTRVGEYQDQNLFDAGLRVSRDIGKGSIGGEITNRRIVKSGWTSGEGNPFRNGKSSQRWAGIFSVPLPANLQIIGSFGTDFKRIDGKRPVIATLGINLGVGAIMLAPSSRPTSL